jgi:hypothetical protein
MIDVLSIQNALRLLVSAHFTSGQSIVEPYNCESVFIRPTVYTVCLTHGLRYVMGTEDEGFLCYDALSSLPAAPIPRVSS